MKSDKNKKIKKKINLYYKGKYTRKKINRIGNKIHKTLKIITLFLISILISCIIYVFFFYYSIYKNQNEISELLDNIIIDESLLQAENLNNNENKVTERMLKVQKLQEDNSDIIGWIEIENTKINYPVLQADNNDFYMNHDYKKKYSSSGSIFLDKNYDLDIPSSNLLIYGHNMNNGTMFQNLLKYKNELFYKNHPTIRFTTSYEDSIYEIIAVFESRVYYKSEKNVFRYYFFIDAKNEKEFNEYVENSKKASLYNTGKTAKYGDQLITLSTCAYHTKDGRFVVVARKNNNYTT